jgi:PAS domain S-box-containing protein
MGGEIPLLVEKKSTNLYEKKYHFLGREIYEFVHPDDAKKITKVLFRRPKSHDFIPEIRLKNDKNQFIWYEIKARRIKDYNNQRKILITLKNISKIKVLEERLEKKEENYQKITNSFPEIQFWKVFTPNKYERAIRTTSEMLKVIIENIPQCVFWKDTNFKYLGCNGNYSEFIGIERPESIIGKTDEDLLSNREKIQQIRESETSVMLSGKSLYHTNETWIIEKGENIWLDVSRVPLIDTKGDVNGILGTFEEITDRKIAEEKLRNSEKKYKILSNELETIMDIIPSMIFVKNKSGIYTRVNQVFADYLKLEKEDIIGKSTFELFPQEFATNLKRDDLEVIKNGIPKMNIEETVEFPEGKVSGIISKMPYYDEKDEINGVIGFAIDISERKKLEQRLIKSEERYRILANSLPQVISETDERGKLIFVNNNAYSVFGYTPDDFNKGLNALQMLIPEDRKRAMENIKRVLRGKQEEKMRENEYTALRKDGSTFPVIIYSSPIIYKDTSVGIRSIIIDITDQKKAEQKLKESEEKLKESEKRYRYLFETSPYAIVLMDRDGHLIDCNDAITKYMSMHSKLDVIGKNIKEILSFNKKNKYLITLFEAHFDKILKGETKEPFEIQLYLSKDGFRWCHVQGSIVQIGNKELVHFIIQDITDRKKAEQKLKESEELLRLERDNLTNILNSMMDGVYVVNQNYDIEFVNPVLIEEFGPIELKKCFEYFHDREEVCSWCKNQDVFAGKTVRWEWFSFKNQKTYDLVDTPLKNPDGSISKLEIFHDITERKKIDQILKESQKKYKLLSEELELILDHIVGPLFYKDTKNNFIWVNKYIADAYKMKREDLIGKSLFELVPKEVAQTYWDDDLEVINSGKPKLNIEEKWETVDGLKWVLTTKIPYIDENGEIKGIIGTSVDITERKIAKQKLIEAEAKHRGLLETAVMGLIEIDLLLNNISYVNPKLLEIVGYSREELKDDSIFYKILHPEDLEELLKSHGDRDVEFRIYSKEGKLKWLSGTRKYTISENGELINIRLWLQDITESKEIEEIKSSLLTRFSHEFKTPLISIKGFTDFL